MECNAGRCCLLIDFPCVSGNECCSGTCRNNKTCA
jgi:hypothetical protein